MHEGTASRGTIIKIVGAYDVGGVRSCELAFTHYLRQAGYTVVGLILGEGATADSYRDAFDVSVTIADGPGAFGSGLLPRLSGVARNELASYGVAREAGDKLSSVLGAAAPICIAVRRSHYLKVAGLLSRRLRVPSYWHMCDTVDDPIGRMYYRSLLTRFGIRPVGNSRYTIRTLLGPDSGREMFIYPGFWTDRIAFAAGKDEARAQLRLPSGVPVFAMISRLHPEKAADIVLDAFVRSAAFQNGGHLVFAGGPLQTPFARAISEKAAAHGDDRVHLMGEVADVAPLIAAADVVVNGRRNAEPFGITIVEAQAAGRPIVAYRKGGPEETISDRQTGWLVNDPTVDGYLQGLDAAWSMRDRWPEMGDAAHRLGMRFSAEAQVQAYIEMIEKAA